MSTQTIRLPTGTVSSDFWTSSTGKAPANYYQDVDDPVGTPDDDLSYVSTMTSPSKVLFSFENPGIPSSSTIHFVRVFLRGYTAVASYLYPHVKVGGNEYTSGAGLEPENYWGDFTNDWLTNPKTGSPWTVDDVNGIGSNALEAFGVSATGFIQRYVTQCYLVIDYTAPAGWYARIAGLTRHVRFARMTPRR